MDFDAPVPEHYAQLRSLIARARINGEESGRIHSAMLSLLDKKEEAGERCPGYVQLLKEAEEICARG